MRRREHQPVSVARYGHGAWARGCELPVIGRHAELDTLEAALAEAADGRPSVAFVAGDSGSARPGCSPS
jgi:hypothetical protein